ncbi:hypothetical protein FJ959_08755 [Mesorhizobium sp. B2-2-4]|uniref:hypothetical protein n=1 Tax=unclassified Mesorhizobium TaxID=325217 RepID=UPI00112D4073|nr:MULTISPECIES: hypothetical protein [unclassified Mesorhizobium]TPM58954.1 hypothetical protein FJ959_08755 [Mesorhizobium sp. B2-2-4]TPM67439.1 hypothetical protein FJ965_09895 [Mesorhizobium sp. B2-2-1]
MTIPATWLVLMLALAAYAWFAYRKPYVLPVLAAAAALAMYVPTGTPRLTAPPAGHYTVLGADIQVDVAIYALLKPEGGPAVYYRLPYSTAQANALQAAMDGEGGASATVGEGGGVAYDGAPPVSGDEAKHAEQPQLNVGG